jgi:hypothetical protein
MKKMLSYLSSPSNWKPLRSFKNNAGVMMPEIRKLAGNPNLQFYFDWGCTLDRDWKSEGILFIYP